MRFSSRMAMCAAFAAFELFGLSTNLPAQVLKGSAPPAAAAAPAATEPLPAVPENKTKSTPAQTKAALAKLKAQPAHLSPMYTNTQLPATQAAMVAALRQQKTAPAPNAQTMSATGNSAGGSSSGSSTPPAGTPGAAGSGTNPSGGTPGTTGSNPNNPNGSGTNPAGGQSTPPGGGSNPSGGGMTRTVTQAKPSISTMAHPTTVTTVQPPASSSGTSPVNPALSHNTSVDPCYLLNGPPVIKGINGEQTYAPGVFSQDPQYNPFWLIGCHFGTSAGKAYLTGSNGQKIADMQVSGAACQNYGSNLCWSDTLVRASLDPSLVDLFDQDNVTLVITSASGQSGQKTGYKFFALRKEILLASIPRGQVTWARIVDSGGQNLGAYFSSPYRGLGFSLAYQSGTTEAIADLEDNNADKGMTAGMDRNDFYRFGGGTDVYDFSKLKPGFGVSRWQLDERTMPICHEGIGIAPVVPVETDYNDGSWNVQFFLAQQQIHVSFAEEHCHMSDNGTDSSNSTYGMNVWVSGPAMSANNSPWQAGIQ